ncbi:MAG: Acetyl-coenzyme A synthetase [Methanocella sp. PtaU1.Bin125]|nr:MAG: Acetyl-coenzyme A synthetase [Methanocella sp. PtaU1.Bin125]
MLESICGILNACRGRDAIAIEAPGKRPLTYGRLCDQAEYVRDQLHDMGYRRGDRFAIVLPNGPEMAVAFLAVGSGFCCAPLNPAYRAEELGFYLPDLRADAVVVPAGDPGPAAATAASLGIPILTLSPAGDEAGLFTLAGGRGKGGADRACAGPEDVALLLHTSGTTSRPKLVPLHQSSVIASARQIAASLALAGADKCLNVMPLFHVHGLIGALLATIVSGGSVVCAPGYQAADFPGWLRDCGPTWYTAVPAIHQKVLEQAKHAPAGPLRLRFIRSSSAAMPAVVRQGLEQAFGVPVIEAYGMTEASHQIATNPLPPLPRKPGSVGTGTGLEIAIMGDRGDFLPPGAQGEIVLRGPRLRGYENNPAANEKAFVRGWFRTGDLGHMDPDGYLFIDARLKEVINRGGEKISPAEVEDALLSHPSVREAAAFAVPDALLGESAGAAVVLRDGAAVDAGELKRHVAARLAYFKVPVKLWFLDAIPRGPTGKVQRVGMYERLNAIAVPEPGTPARGYEPPATPTEAALAQIWAGLLNRERIGRRDSFLDLGGDSLLATMAISRISEALGVKVPIAQAMDCENIAELGEAVDRLVRDRKPPL